MKQDQTHTKYNGLDELYAIEKFLPKYNHKIVHIFLKHLENDMKNKCLVDFGAGIGTLTEIIKNKTGIVPICIEIDKTNKKFLFERGFKHFENLSDVKGEVDIVFSSNVLEHIKDDKKIIRDIYKKLKIDGVIFLYLPAKKSLWTSLDFKVGHYRRYEKSDLINKLQSCGFMVEKCHFSDSIGFFLTLVGKIFSSKVDLELSPNLLRFYDYIILPVSNVFDFLGLNKIVGKNIVIYAKKK